VITSLEICQSVRFLSWLLRRGARHWFEVVWVKPTVVVLREINICRIDTLHLHSTDGERFIVLSDAAGIPFDTKSTR
jgi:hypothetical protein